ncbi:MAG TPA: nuclear transport factor 2 family protein [Candidatus Binatia bacterium]|jgi:ketosteroid isomerase-like protein|nr:nuclear transport factor 2 family protein [Candidatus Binatia bacterium]
MNSRICQWVLRGAFLAALFLPFVGSSAESPTPAEEEVRQAADAFYAALNRMFTGDMGPMSEIWSHASDVTDMGPFGGRLVGWEKVGAEFEREAKMKLGGKVEARDVVVRVGGDLGYTLCVEHGENMSADGKPVTVDHRATNIFRREAGKWKLIHHHTDISEALQKASHPDKP